MQCKRNANAMQTQCKRNANAMQLRLRNVHLHWNANALQVLNWECKRNTIQCNARAAQLSFGVASLNI
jgi:hypothetical protein